MKIRLGNWLEDVKQYQILIGRPHVAPMHLNFEVHPKIYIILLVGARDGRTQSARACLFFFLHSKPIPQKT